MHLICYVILFVAYTLGAAAYGGLLWNTLAKDPGVSKGAENPFTEVPASTRHATAKIVTGEN